MQASSLTTIVDITYLDHAGTTLYAKTVVDTFARDLASNLFGNPHSGSASSQLSTRRIEDVRLKVLDFFSADPEAFDVVFVSNATAGIKLVMDIFRDIDGGFSYGYHRDAHNSLVGVREVAAAGHTCFESEAEAEAWLAIQEGRQNASLEKAAVKKKVCLFAYPAQSNLSGERLPLSWSSRLRKAHKHNTTVYTLLDASSHVSTSPLSLADPCRAPDFTVLSFYKIFGFPPLGCLIIRKAAPNIDSLLRKRKYFGGGTVDVVTCLDGQAWHVKKTDSMHDHLEDGTLPFHSIIALGHALDTHNKLYGSMERVAAHTALLARRLYEGLSGLRHPNGTPVARIYTTSDYRDRTRQGPIIAFNLVDHTGRLIPKTQVETTAAAKNIHLRTGGMCNPGGIASHLNWASDDIKTNFEVEGVRCGNDIDIVNGKPTGVIRASLGAMSNLKDVQTLIDFVQETYIGEKTTPITEKQTLLHHHQYQWIPDPSTTPITEKQALLLHQHHQHQQYHQFIPDPSTIHIHEHAISTPKTSFSEYGLPEVKPDHETQANKSCLLTRLRRRFGVTGKPLG